MSEILKSLNILYNEMPKTTGCEDCAFHYGESNVDWCCISEDVLVYTPNGPIPIQEIKKGSLVYTKDGIRKVIRTGKREVAENLIQLKTVHGRNILLTKDHKVYVDEIARRDRELPRKPNFIESGLLKTKVNNKPSSYLIFPKIIDFLESSSCLYISDYIDCFIENNICYNSERKKGYSLNNNIDLDYDFLFIIGLYLAEGSSSNGSVSFHINDSEIELLDKIYFFAKRLQMKCNHKTDHGHAVTVRISSRLLEKFFIEFCGRGCENKRIHPVFFGKILSNNIFRQALLSGLYAGDGSKTHGKRKSIITTSFLLANQIIMLYHIDNVFCGISPHSRPNRKTSFTIHWTEDAEYLRVLETDKDFRCVLIKKEELYYEGFVYDIEIDNGESFFTEAGEMHNCKSLNPSMYFVEFWNAWLEVKNNWNTKQRKSLILRAIKNYLSNSTSKGCIFYDNGCTIHKNRPLSCRMYGVIPNELWQKRVRSLKERYGEDFKVKEQCNVLKSDKEVSIEDEHNWFEQTIALEKELEIPEEVVNAHDLPGGSYRTFHDHLLLEIFPPEYLEMLTKFRLENPSATDIDLTIDEMSKQLDNMVI